jgi:hypothetical protein
VTARRDLGLLAGLGVVLAAVLAVAGLRAWDWWRYQGEIHVDFEPHAPTAAARGSLTGFPHSPDGSLAAVRYGDRTDVVDAATEAPVADLGEVVDTIFVTDAVLVAFGEDVPGPHDGIAVIDLDDQTVDQVDDRAGAEGELQARRVTDEGRVVACELVPTDSSEVCGAERYLIDPEAGELTDA